MADEVAIWGGDIEAGKLSDFLNSWQLSERKMPCRIWEWASDIAFETCSEPDQPGQNPVRSAEWLERGRLFGEGGDLSLRRDGERFLWHFVGPKEAQKPTGYTVKDYWEDPKHLSRELTCPNEARTVLLWGERRGENDNVFWQEDRVAGAKHLVYRDEEGNPMPDKRVQLRYREYLYGDSVEAVWWLGLEPSTEEQS